MASDEIIWQIINQQFCAFKLKYVPPMLLLDVLRLTSSQNRQRPELLPQ